MKPTTQDFLRIEAIFHEALETPDAMRPALIEVRCQGDPELAAEIWALLHACEAEAKMTESGRKGLEAGNQILPGLERVGPYALDRLLGRGGMGAVYLAHRADGQFEQKVAIKLIDLPLATDLFRERFRQERQILAQLQHPYIARLLDGGVTAGGDLYLVMEFVDGVPIHRFCEQHRYSEAERIALFLRVCEAVQFAHHHFVVHRDLKPDNILVDENGTPRLLDFGTAKLLSPSLARPDNQLTREGFQSFTPQYASPEQILGTPITAASDTYSLGVLLYVLLTGTTPYELKELNTAEMLRVICQEPPRKPDHAVGSLKRLDPDVQAILLKALRKEPKERYLIVEQLASDLHAYLEGRPVAARHGTLRYRGAKFIRRHRVGLSAAALLLATLVVGIAGIVWQARVANQQRRKAEARTADLRQLSNSLLSELDEAIKDLPGSTGVQKLLVTRVLEHLDRMANDAQGDRQAQLDLIDAYTRLGNVQGNAYDQNLGDPQGALASLGKALTLALPLVATDGNDHEALRALAVAEQSRSEILWQTGATPLAVPVMREALKNFDALAAAPNATATRFYEAASAYGTLGDELGQNGTNSLGDPVGAVAAYRKSVALDRRALDIDPNYLRARRGLSVNGLKIGSVEMETDPASALKDFQVALEHANDLPKTGQDSLPAVRLRAQLLRKQAIAYERLGLFAQAASYFQQSFEMFHTLEARDPKDLRAVYDLVTLSEDEAESYEDAADPLLAAKPGERRHNLMLAKQAYAQAVAGLEHLVTQDQTNAVWKSYLGYLQVRLGTIQKILSTPGAGAELSRKGLAVLKEAARSDQASPLLLDQAADAFLRVEPASLRDPQFALSCAEREVAISHGTAPFRLLTLARAYQANGQTEKSRAAAKEGLALLPSLPPPGSPKPNIRKLLAILAQPPS
jgi:tetratricopeptide (TPR) repeat protein